jgi:RHS repeat-associated protein
MTYQDAFGNIQSKTETGYTAPAVDQTIDWTSFNYPKRISATVLGGTQQIASFAYGPDRQRWRMVYESGSATETTLYIGGLMEKVTVGTVADYRYYIYAGGSLAAIYSRQSSGTNTVRYVLEDHQGSVASILTGTSTVNESFTAYGNRRDATTWSSPPSAADLQSMNSITRRGYTGHTALGSMGLNHMNGRVQDAITGTFLSPDPYVTQPGNTQGFNRYAYAHNNPLTFIDPSGFDIVCWMPPSSYGGTHIFMGPDGPVEGPIALGSRGSCTPINTPGYQPGASAGGGGGGFNIPAPSIDMTAALREICEAEVEADFEKPETKLHRDLDLTDNLLTPGEVPLGPLGASLAANAVHRAPKEVGAYAMIPFPRTGQLYSPSLPGWQLFQRTNSILVGASATGIGLFGMGADLVSANESLKMGDRFQAGLDAFSAGAGAASFVSTPYGLLMWVGAKSAKPVMKATAKSQCRGTMSELPVTPRF